ncbi:MAG: protein translocase subunit SecF, partial [Acetobacteraceae bacterium]
MFLHPTLRLVRDNTKIRFMRGRFLGILTSAVLSVASIVLFFHPGLNLGIDFRGGIVIQARTPGPADFAALRASFATAGLGDAG